MRNRFEKVKGQGVFARVQYPSVLCPPVSPVTQYRALPSVTR